MEERASLASAPLTQQFSPRGDLYVGFSKRQLKRLLTELGAFNEHSFHRMM